MQEKAKSSPLRAEFITRQQVADWLSISTQTVDKLVRENVLSAYRVGRCVRLRRDEVLAYVEGRRVQ